MIGAGASGMQTGPSIAPGQPSSSALAALGQSAALCSPKSPTTWKWVIKHVPYFVNWFRFQLFWSASDGFHRTLQMDPNSRSRTSAQCPDNHKVREDLVAYVKSHIGDRPDLMAKAIPPYPPFGKRMLRDNNWYEMLKRPNVDLVTDKVGDHVEGNAVCTDGKRYPTDVIVLATGFEARRFLGPIEVYGRGDALALRAALGRGRCAGEFLASPCWSTPEHLLLLIFVPDQLGHGGGAIFHSRCRSAAFAGRHPQEMIEASARRSMRKARR